MKGSEKERAAQTATVESGKERSWKEKGNVKWKGGADEKASRTGETKRDDRKGVKGGGQRGGGEKEKEKEKERGCTRDHDPWSKSKRSIRAARCSTTMLRR